MDGVSSYHVDAPVWTFDALVLHKIKLLFCTKLHPNPVQGIITIQVAWCIDIEGQFNYSFNYSFARWMLPMSMESFHTFLRYNNYVYPGYRHQPVTIALLTSLLWSILSFLQDILKVSWYVLVHLVAWLTTIYSIGWYLVTSVANSVGWLAGLQGLVTPTVDHHDVTLFRLACVHCGLQSSS